MSLLNALDAKLVTSWYRAVNEIAPILRDDNGSGNSTVDAVLNGFGTGNAESDPILGNATKSAKALGNSIYGLVFYIVIMAASIAILIVALKILFGGSQGKAEGKTNLLWIVVAIAIAAGAISIVKLIASGTAGLFN